jgi:putative SOS response-associated peptidase YedK
MCERYVLPEQAAAEREFQPALSWWNFTAKFNVAAQHYVPTIRWHDGRSEAAMMRWGLIPGWAEGRVMAPPPTVVEDDALLDSPTFRGPWLNSQRCILPMAGFYAWQLTRARYRQPYFVSLLERGSFGVAGIWDRTVSEEDDDVIESCAVICVPSNQLLIRVANTDGRMPAILRRRDYQTWLRGTPVEAKAALAPYKQEWMQAHAVSPRINSSIPDDAGLIAPATQ